MDSRLLRYYDDELAHLRQTAAEFAQQNPKIALRLGLDEFKCEDPYVERLLEGFAYLTSRVQLKFDAQFPRLIHGLFETVCPQYLAPTPAIAIVTFAPDLAEGSLAEGPCVDRGSRLRSPLAEGEQTRCVFTTAHDVTLWPIEVVEASYHTRDVASLGLSDVPDARAAIRMRLRVTAGVQFNELPLDRLVLHLTGEGRTAMGLYEQLLTHLRGVVVHATTRPSQWEAKLPPSAIRQVGFGDDEALFPAGPRSYSGYRLLQEYFACPQRFMFVELRGLNAALQIAQGDELDVTFLLDEVDLELENRVGKRNFALFCTPAINLFEKRLDRIHLNDRVWEFHLMPERTAPLDYEVHSVVEVTGYGTRSDDEQEFASFYSAKDMGLQAPTGYYATHRIPRTLSERERRGRRRSSYGGSEAYMSLVDLTEAPYSPDLRQVGVVARCTNRDLTINMPVGHGTTDFTLDTGAPVGSIRCVGTPTAPRASHAEGEFAWRLVSHLTLNYLSLVDTDKGDAASTLKDMLRLYGDISQPDVRREIDGVVSVTSKPVLRRVGEYGPTSFARGLEVTVTLDEAAFEGSGIFLLGTVLEQFFARHVSMNGFTETVIRGLKRGEVKRWPARVGKRHML